MKIKIIFGAALVGGCLICDNANATCSAVALQPGQTCAQAGGKTCNDGSCRMCCTEDSGGGGTTPCSGSYTTDTSETFSNYMGSGYIKKQLYSSACQCRFLEL